MKQVDWSKKLQETILNIKLWVNETIEANRAELVKIKHKLGIHNDKLNTKDHIKIIRHISDFVSQAKNDYNADKYLKYDILLSAYFALLLMDKLDLQVHDEYDAHDYYKIFLIGQIRGAYVPFEKNIDIYEEHFHKQRSANLRLKGHSLRNQEYEAALAYAERSWREEGDEMYHHQMARHIMTIYPNLYKPTLLKRLKPIAKKYGRFWNPNASKKE